MVFAQLHYCVFLPTNHVTVCIQLYPALTFDLLDRKRHHNFFFFQLDFYVNFCYNYHISFNLSNLMVCNTEPFWEQFKYMLDPPLLTVVPCISLTNKSKAKGLIIELALASIAYAVDCISNF